MDHVKQIFNQHKPGPATTLLLIVALAGCGGGAATVGTSDADRIADVVLGLSDAAGSEEAFKASFVSGSVPENREDYASSAYELTGTPQISGDQASVGVKVISGIINSQKGDAAAEEAPKQERTTTEVTWTLQQEGDAWKIKDAPLK